MAGGLSFDGVIQAPMTLGEFNKHFTGSNPVADDSWMDEDFMTRGFSFLKDEDPNSKWNKDMFAQGSVRPSQYLINGQWVDRATAASMPLSTNTALGANASTMANNSALSQYAPIVSQMAAKYNVPESLIYAVMNTESAGNPNAVSPAGAQGLMQLMPNTARTMGVTNSFDPAQNIEGGVKYLALMLQKYGGDQKLALWAYNAGPGTVDKHLSGQGKLPAETAAYVPKINQYLNLYS